MLLAAAAGQGSGGSSDMAISSSESGKIALNALERMQSLNIPATPDNFTVWYHYCGDVNAELTRAINVLMRSPKKVSAEDSAYLYDRFFGSVREEVSGDVAKRLEEVMMRAAGDLNAAGVGAAAFGNALADASGALAAETSGGASVAQIVNGIVAASRQMEARTRELERRLEAASSEVTLLRTEVEEARREAFTDGLTGLANRKQFDLKLHAECQSAIEMQQPLSLLMLDLDHFKRFNDEHGHQVGDQVLRLLGEVVRQCVKGSDTAARYGGEEFSIILPSCPLLNAKAVANTVRDRIAKKQIVNRTTGKPLGAITLSVGAALYRPGEDLAAFIERADSALYRAKKEGRNRCVSELEMRGPAMAF